MVSFWFTIAAAGLIGYGRAVGAPREAVCWWLAALLGAFWIARTVLQKSIEARDSNTLDELYDTYLAGFGATSLGGEFLEHCQPWRQRLDSSLGLLSFFRDGHAGVANRLATAAAERLSAKPIEQRMLEDAIRSLAKTSAKHRSSFSRSIWLTTIAFVGIGMGTQTALLPPPIGRPPATVRTYYYASAAKAHRVAIRRYPKLAVRGSKLNTAFVARATVYRETRPDYFRDNGWPIRLADTLAAVPLARL